MVDVSLSQMDEATASTGEEQTLVSQLSPTVTITAATISAQASDDSFNDSGNGFIAAGFAVNDRVHVSGFTGNAANNIFSGVIATLTAGKMTISGAEGAAIADDAAGETVTISKWVSRRKALSEATGFSGALLYLSGNLASANYTTATAISFDSEDYDTDGFHSAGSPTRITIPSGVSKVRLSGGIEYASGTAGTFGELYFTKNGGTSYNGFARQQQESGIATGRLTLSSPVLQVTAGDYFEMLHRQESDTSVVVNASPTWFAIEVVE